MVRAHVVISGIVQGVFFRHYTREKALELDVKGWVRNRMDGTVEAVFEGEKESVEKLLDWCKRGPSGARVSGVDVVWEDYGGEFSSFQVRI